MMENRLPITVSELNEYVRVSLAGDPLLRCIRVTGEISGYKQHISGHRYFSLKDEKARIQCVMFRQNAQSLLFQPRDGMRVTITGAVSLFVRDGAYQLYAETMEQQGAGNLFQQFEALKRKLMAEGLFDPARKRELPFRPTVIGVATSKTGAAVRDIIRVAKRRDPGVGIVVAPCSVQGERAADEIVKSIRLLNRQGQSQVLLVGRGGGSMEDLWPFNEEKVARAIAESRIPVISCVGHETDFTIADFVADVRAATPSMAAEMAVPVRAELENARQALSRRLLRSLESGQRLRRLRLEKCMASAALSDPARLTAGPREKTALSEKRLREAMAKRLSTESARLSELNRTLRAVSPQAVLDRGYAAVKKGGCYVSRAEQLRSRDQIELILSDGVRRAQVLEEEEHGGKNDL
ncbi:MAG: exodeoxyribonuclease VII large subunit [Eubacteriales bacterium]|nr:exodeoxyribonuclease VII large subunit [Eubacteriales bacterium]MDY2602353.1 exodeoxyribonuclease VII large subunit [Eubacteriales bacterium]